MRVLRFTALGMIAAMVTAVTIAFLTTPFSVDGRQLIDLAWGRVTIIDLYLALAVFVLWVGWRDGALKALGWGALTVFTGSAAIGVYLLLASRQAHTVADVLTGPRRKE
jgi:hypothetical protein